MISLKRRVASVLFIFLLGFALIPVTPPAAAQTVSYLTVNLAGTRNVNDVPSGIVYDGVGQYVYMTLQEQGALVKIDKDTRAYTFHDKPGASANGESFDVVVIDANGKIWTADQKGYIWKYDPVSDAWVSARHTLTVVHAAVTELSPVSFRVAEGAPHGNHDYIWGAEITSGIFSQGFLWFTTSYHWDFDAFAEALGVQDVVFNGLVKVDPVTLAVTRINFTSASHIIGLAAEGDNIYVSDRAGGKIFKYTISTGDIVVLASGLTNPAHLDVDASYVYAALQTEWVPPDGTSKAKFAKIARSDGTVTVVDLGIVLGMGQTGTFTVKKIGSLLAFSDLSYHVGTYNLLTTAVISFTTVTSANYFMTQVGPQMWVAGRGSAKIVQMELPSGSFDLPPPPETSPATVTLTANITEIISGQKVLLSGRVSWKSQPVSSEVIIYSFALSGAFLGEVVRMRSDMNGSFSYVWTPSYIGGSVNVYVVALASQGANRSPDLTLTFKPALPTTPAPKPSPINGLGTFVSTLINDADSKQVKIYVSNKDLFNQQSAVILVQIKNSAGVVVYLGAAYVVLGANGAYSDSVGLGANSDFTVQVFVWRSLSDATALAEKSEVLVRG